MFTTIRDMIVGAVVAAAVGGALGSVGQVPVPGFQTVDGSWLLGVAGGSNYTYQSGITAAGTTQATAPSLPANVSLIEIDTVPGSSGVALPPCLAGTQMTIYNATATTVLLYPAIANNPVTAAQDTINNATSLSLSGHTATSPACAKNGIWGAS